MDLNLKGKVALITGGSHGIGQSICISLANEGCSIAYFARGQRYNLYDTAHKIWDNNGICYPIQLDADIKNPYGAASIIKELILEKFGKIDILVNNIGGGSSWGDSEKWHNTLPEKWNDVMSINYGTTVAFTNQVIPVMMSQMYGRIISISSIYGKESGGMPWFQSAKSAQISLMKSYASNDTYFKNGITFNTVCPGFIDMEDKKVSGPTDDFENFGKVDNISPLVTFLSSDKASYINGACITVDGGFSKSF